MHSLFFIPVLFGLPSLCGLIDTQYPHLIIPLELDKRDQAIGTVKEFDIERDVYTEFLFDVPNNAAAWCNLHLTISTDPAKNVPWHVWGPSTGPQEPYTFNVSTLAAHINKNVDSWSSHPKIDKWVATFKVWANGRVEQSGGMFMACAKGGITEFVAHPADWGAEGGFKIFELSEPLHGFTYEGWVTDGTEKVRTVFEG